MRTIYHQSKIFINFSLSGAIAAVFLMSGYASAKPVPKAPAKSVSGRVKPDKAKTASAKIPLLRLKRHVFPDVTMGASAAYTVMLPVNWSAQGKIEWQPSGDVSFPQKKIEITSPQKGRISFDPMTTFHYVEGPGMPSQGVPAPANFPEWLVQVVPQTDPKIRNVKLVKSTRDTKTEALLKKLSPATSDIEREIYTIVLDYDESNVRRRDEINVTYVRYAPYFSRNLNSQMWSIYPGGSISAPVNQFAAQRMALLNVANTLCATPSWFLQSQAVIAEMSRRRVANNWEIIKERGRQIGRVSDDEYAQYKQKMASSDNAQHTRINGIYETDDFRDTNGDIVNLPMHYQHIFSDGKGNYVLSNNSQDKPGELWKPIKPMK